MRLLRLDLEKYGAFDGRSLVFRADARLHVVLGPNEAGKSSALAAVSDLLFGFGQRTDYAFRHAMGDLRLGAEIEGSSGRRETFRRRKGTRATLVDADDRPLMDDLLAPFIGQMTRDVFERAFGLAARSLRDGAEELLSADGDSGASLFAAASGLRGVEDLRKALEAEADALFTPQARTKPFNDLSKRHEAAREALRAAELGATAWRRLNDAIATLEEKHETLSRRRAELRTERARLERLTRARAAAVEVERAAAALDALGVEVVLTPAGAALLADRLDAAEAARAAATRAADALRCAVEDAEKLRTDEAALAAADEIERLVRETGAFEKASRTDLPRVGREADAKEEELARLAVRLGLPDAAAVEARLPTDAARASLKALIREGRELSDAAARKASAAEEERRSLTALEARRGEGPVVDPRVARDAFAALAPRLKGLERQEELGVEHAREARAIAEAAARMSPAVTDLDHLAGRSLPGLEAIARARREQDAKAADAGRAAAELSATEAEAERIRVELSGLASGGVVASPEAIRAARRARDAQWAGLRAHLSGANSLRIEAIGEAVPRFERLTDEADGLADRATEHAERAAVEARLSARLAELGATAEAQSGRLKAIRDDEQSLRDSWREAWGAAGVAPETPDVMAGWRRDLGTLLERRERNAEREAVLARLSAAESALRPELAAIAEPLKILGVSDVSAVDLAARIEARLTALGDRWREAGQLEAQLADLKSRIGRLDREISENQAARKAWAARWAAAAPTVGLDPAVAVEAAEAALEAWGLAPALIAERAGLTQRMRGMSRDAEAFRRDVSALISGFAGDLADLPPEAAAGRLGRRLTEARRDEAMREAAAKRREDARTAEAAAARDVQAAEAGLNEAAAGLPAGADLRAEIAKAQERQRLAAALADRRAELFRVAENADEAAIRAEFEGFDPDAAPARIDELSREEARTDEERQTAFAELQAERARRDSFGGAEAEKAAAEQRAAAAAMHAMGRDWAVRKIAALLIGAAVERARAADRNPVLDRAADLFRTLTGGSFAGFSEDYEKDQPTLVGRRASGETVPVRGMSEGTRDQFYLALRLAFLDDYAARAEAPPFIGDDLFASFDDARVAHGLKALADIGDRVQPILFTHHRSVAEIAKATLGHAVDLIELSPVTR